MINDTAKTMKIVAINPSQEKPVVIPEAPSCHKPDTPDSYCDIFSAVTWPLSGAVEDLIQQASLFNWIVWIMSHDLRLFHVSLSISFLRREMPDPSQGTFPLLSLDLNQGENQKKDLTAVLADSDGLKPSIFPFLNPIFFFYMTYVKKMNKQHPCSWSILLVPSGDKSLRPDL